MVCRAAFLPDVLGEESASSLFQTLEDACIPWLRVPSSIFKASSVASSFCSPDSLKRTLLIISDPPW
jgi:hypothetical protein